MTSLQLGLIIAGIALVVGVLIFNAWQERRIRRRIDAAFKKPEDAPTPTPPAPRASRRVEPTLGAAGAGPQPAAPEAIPENEAAAPFAPDGPGYEAPIDIRATIAAEEPAAPRSVPEPLGAASGTGTATAARPEADRGVAQPDADIECVITLQPAKPVTAGALAVGLHARLGKPLRWFGRRAPGATFFRSFGPSCATCASITGIPRFRQPHSTANPHGRTGPGCRASRTRPPPSPGTMTEFDSPIRPGGARSGNWKKS